MMAMLPISYTAADAGNAAYNEAVVNAAEAATCLAQLVVELLVGTLVLVVVVHKLSHQRSSKQRVLSQVDAAKPMQEPGHRQLLPTWRGDEVLRRAVMEVEHVLEGVEVACEHNNVNVSNAKQCKCW